MARSLIRYLGGKSLIIHKLLPYVPDHKCYAEVFGGAGNMLFAKKPAMDIYNDINGDVVNLFRVLRDKEKYEEFKRLVALTPVSREEFYRYRQSYREGNDVERAYKFYYIMKVGFGGKLQNHTFGMAVTTTRTCGLAKTVTDYLSGIESLDKFAQRLMTVVIENLDYKDIFTKYIQHWDYDTSFVYLDPPYVPQARIMTKVSTYEYEMSYEQHVELVELVNKYSSRAKIMLQGYDNELYNRELEKKGWQKISFETYCSACGRISQSKYKGENKLKEMQKRIDCIWINYTIPKESLYGEQY